jgi:hypothetical protein
VLLGQEVAERQREHDRRHEQRLDDREAAAVERPGLKQVPGEQRKRADQPRPLAEQPHQRHRICQRDRRQVQRPFCWSAAASANRNAATSARVAAMRQILDG